MFHLSFSITKIIRFCCDSKIYPHTSKCVFSQAIYFPRMLMSWVHKSLINFTSQFLSKSHRRPRPWFIFQTFVDVSLQNWQKKVQTNQGVWRIRARVGADVCIMETRTNAIKPKRRKGNCENMVFYDLSGFAKALCRQSAFSFLKSVVIMRWTHRRRAFVQHVCISLDGADGAVKRRVWKINGGVSQFRNRPPMIFQGKRLKHTCCKFLARRPYLFFFTHILQLTTLCRYEERASEYGEKERDAYLQPAQKEFFNASWAGPSARGQTSISAMSDTSAFIRQFKVQLLSALTLQFISRPPYGSSH